MQDMQIEARNVKKFRKRMKDSDIVMFYYQALFVALKSQK